MPGIRRRDFVALLGGAALGRSRRGRSNRPCRWSGSSPPWRIEAIDGTSNSTDSSGA